MNLNDPNHPLHHRHYHSDGTRRTEAERRQYEKDITTNKKLVEDISKRLAEKTQTPEQRMLAQYRRRAAEHTARSQSGLEGEWEKATAKKAAKLMSRLGDELEAKIAHAEEQAAIQAERLANPQYANTLENAASLRKAAAQTYPEAAKHPDFESLVNQALGAAMSDADVDTVCTSYWSVVDRLEHLERTAAESIAAEKLETMRAATVEQLRAELRVEELKGREIKRMANDE